MSVHIKVKNVLPLCFFTYCIVFARSLTALQAGK